MNDEPSDARIDRLIATAPLLVAISDRGSFAGAAEHLGIDPSAVSHRIRALESALGLRLFERTTRSVRPTRSGAILCDAARRALGELDRAVAAAREIRTSTIRLSAASSVAMKWLVPRLPSAADDGLDLSVDVFEGLSDLGHGGVDAALRFGVGPYPGLHATRLARCELQPVVAARLIERAGPTIDPLAPDGLPLLGDRGSGRWRGLVSWEEYADRLVRKLEPQRARQDFDRADVMLQAAIAGLGIALGRTLLIEDDIRNGLLAPVGSPARIDACYWLVTSHEHAGTERITALTSWLKRMLVASDPAAKSR